jgi:hypothetical protein
VQVARNKQGPFRSTPSSGTTSQRLEHIAGTGVGLPHTATAACDDGHRVVGDLSGTADSACTQRQPDTLSRGMERAYPFLISTILILVGLVATSRQDARVNRYATGSADTNVYPKLSGELVHLQPGQLRNVVLYWIETTQATALIIGPVLGVLIFTNLSNPWVAGVYGGAIVIGIGLIIWLALIGDESKYSGRIGRLGFTPVTSVALIIDVAAGVVAYAAR